MAFEPVNNFEILKRILEGNIDTSEFMKKEDFVSKNDKTSVNLSDYAKKIECVAENSTPNVYYGNDDNGKDGVFSFPVGLPDESTIQNRVFNEIYVGWEDSVKSLVPLNDKVIISVLRFQEQKDNVNETLRQFNNKNELGYTHTDQILIDNEKMGIKNVYNISPDLNTDNVYEYDLSEFVIIEGVE